MRILLAEDDEKLNETLVYGLTQGGFIVDACFDGEDALFYGEQNIYDIILLDRMLPCMEGTDVLASLREKGISTPVILITALGTLSDKVEGLDLGADDYLVKPFALEELLVDEETRTFSDIVWLPAENRLTGPAGNCTLSKREATLLEAFLKSGGATLSRNHLLLKVWGPDSDVEEGNLDNYIHFLRRRLKTVGSRLNLKTVRGVGYTLTEPS